MATRYIGITQAAGPKAVGGDVIGAASGGTLAGSQNLQVVFDDAVYGSSPEGKQRLLAGLKLIQERIKAAKVWPIAATS
jgi:hypothetical protein